MAGAERGLAVGDAGGEAHAQEGASPDEVLSAVGGGCGGGRRGGGWRGSCAHEQLAVVDVVEGDSVGLAGGHGGIGARDQGPADGDLGGEADDDAGDVVVCERGDGLVDVTWVAAEQAAVQEEDLASGMCGRVEKRGPAHVQGVLQTGLSLGLQFSDALQTGNMVRGVAACVGNTLGEAVSHADNG